MRFFLSPHPTFGSYRQPLAFKIEASPYFWWWYALTLNEGYRQLCADMADKSTVAQLASAENADYLRIYKDFGDVRYEGCRYKAFCNWWRAKLANGETRGVFLFAEPLTDTAVRHIEDGDAAAKAASDDSVIVIAIPRHMQRQHVDNALDRILRKQLKVRKGRNVRNPSRSQARYHLTKPAVPAALKIAFDVYDAKMAVKTNGKKLSNTEIAKRANLPYREREKADEAAYTDAERSRVISMLVSRHVANVRKMIDGAGKGVFPAF